MRHENKLLTLTWRKKAGILKRLHTFNTNLRLLGGWRVLYTWRQHLYKPDSIKVLQVCSHFHRTLAICGAFASALWEKKHKRTARKNKGAFVSFSSRQLLKCPLTFASPPTHHPHHHSPRHSTVFALISLRGPTVECQGPPRGRRLAAPRHSSSLHQRPPRSAI